MTEQLLHGADVHPGHRDHGVDPSLRMPDGSTPLHLAASYCPAQRKSLGKTDVNRLLLARGAHVNATTNDGQTPLDVALQVNDTAVIRVLRENGAVEGKPLPASKACRSLGRSARRGTLVGG